MSARGPIPDLSTIAGRLKAERLRLGMSQLTASRAGGVSKNGWINWEASASSPTAVALAAFAEAGADVLFIVTGQRIHQALAARPEPIAGLTVRRALAMLDTFDRQRLLLDLLLGEMRT